jgi:tetratricopeptide (TPR) repeat protein
MPKTCASCGAVSESGQGYQSTAFVHPKDWCPVCYPKVKSREGWWTLASLPVALAMSWVLTKARYPNDRMGWLLLNATLALAWTAVVVLPHELGHALLAKAVGWRVFKVVVGFGPLLFKRPFLGGTLEVHAHPWGGHTICTTPTEQGYRLRRMVLTAGGPLVNLLLILAVLPWLPSPNPLKGFQTSWCPLAAFAFANAWSFVLGLIPFRFASTIGTLNSDGLALFRTPFLSRDEVRQGVAVHYLLQGMIHLDAKQLEDAARWYEEGLQRFPESSALRNDYGVALLRRREFQRARDILLPILSAEKVEPSLRGITLNNIAFADLLLERPDLVEEALRFSEEAMNQVGWNPPIRGTRSLALIVGGRIDEGLALAKEMLERNEEPEKKGFNALTLALGCKARGDVAEGRKYLEMAERLAPDDHLLPRVRREFAS